jgi:ribonuclease P protein component
VAVALTNQRPGEPSRLGLAVRSQRGAVARNRVKRRLRAAFVQAEPVEGYDVVLRGDDRLLGVDYSTLVEDLRIALNRVVGAQT